MYKLADFFDFDEKVIREGISKIFQEEKWVKAFLEEDHHGIKHGDKVRIGCLELIERFTQEEKNQFSEEGNKIKPAKPFESARAVAALAAIFHDCGRFNDNGEIVGEEQKFHNILSAERAVEFCKRINSDRAIPYIEDATLSHDYQNKKKTEHLEPPKTIIGKVVQSSDQLGWFHPSLVNRTIEYSKAIGVSFFNESLNLKQRIDWTPSIHDANDEDVVTVLLHGLFGPTGSDRFGIEAARATTHKNKKVLRKSIIKESRARGVEEKVLELIAQFEKIEQTIYQTKA